MKDARTENTYRFSIIAAGLTVFYFACRMMEALFSMGAYSANPDSEALGNRVASAVAALSAHEVLICLLSAVISAAVGIIVCRSVKKAGVSPYRILMVTEALFYGVIFVSYGELPNDYTDFGFSGLNLSFLNRAYLFVFGLLACFCVRYLKDRSETFEKAFSARGFRALWVLFSLWISFSLVGKPLFMPFGRTPWKVTPLTVTVFVMFYIWIQPLLAALFTILADRSDGGKGEKVHPAKAGIRTGLVFFGIFVCVWLLYLIACNPGNISLDAAIAWQEIVGDKKISSLFPPLIKIFYRILCTVIPSVYVIGVTQILLMSLAAAAFVMFLYRQGFDKKRLMAGSAIFAVFPSNGIFVVTFTSNFYYMLCMCVLTLCILEYFTEGKTALRRASFCIALGLSVYGLYFMRNEGRYISLLTGLLLLIAALKMKEPRIMITAAGAAAGVLATAFLLFPAFGTGNGEIQSFDYWRNILWSAAYYGGELPERAESYNGSFEKFTEGDFNYNGCPPEKPERMTREERMEAVSYVVRNDFPEVLRDRLNKSDVVWDVTEAVSAHNVREITMVVPGTYGFERKDNALTALLVKCLYPVTIAIAPLDCLCYRSGIWIDLALMLILVFAAGGRKRYILSLLPVLVHSMVFMAGLMWQCSRHVYVTGLCVLMVLISLPLCVDPARRDP